MDGYMELNSFGRFAAASLIAAGLASTAVPATLMANPLATSQEASVAASPLPSVSSRTLSGITYDQPFVSNQTGTSQHYRIPSIITLENGWLLAGADARWGVYGDSPENLDGLACISKDGGKTWEWQLVNEFVDYPSKNGGHKGNSASFIDPTFIQGADGTVYMMADAWPAGTGIWGTGGASCESTGFDENGNFLISRGKAGAIASLDAGQYTYHCDAQAKQAFDVDGKRVELTPIKDKDGALTGAWIDAYFDLYTVKDGAAARTVVKQHESNQDIQANVFYSQSEWKAYPTCYIWLVKGTPTEDGIDWGAPSILNVKQKDDQPFTGICPGRGLAIPLEGGGERIMFQIYESKQGGNESASAIWSDDAGATWHRGERANKFNGSGKSSESQTVRLPGGGVRMYSRNAAGAISYADSFDNGGTWSEYSLDPELQYTGNCMVSFINVDGCLVDEKGGVWTNLIAASYPKTSGRRDGAVRIGSIDAATNKVTWLNGNDVKYPGRFLYSCLTQVEDDKMAIVYEQQEPKSDGTQDVIFNRFSLLDLLGEGWKYSAAAPSLSVSKTPESIDAGESMQLTASVEGAEEAEYSWTIEQSQGNAAATLDAKGANAILTGRAAGRATIKVVATVKLDGTPARLETSWDVYVSDQTSTVLPDRLGSHRVDATYEAPYTLATQLPERGAYLIYGQADGGRIMYNLPGGASPDRLRSSISGNAVAPDTSGRFPIENQTWILEKAGDGYAIASAADGRKLSIKTDGDRGYKLTLGDVASTFAIQGEDTSKTVSTAVGERTVYIGMDAKGSFKASETPFDKISLGLAASRDWTVTTELIENVLADAGKIEGADGYTDTSWRQFTEARDEARGALAERKDTYESEAAAKQQKELLDAAAKKLFRAQRALEARPSPNPKPDPEPNPKPDPEPNPQPQPNPDRSDVTVETDASGNEVTTIKREDGTSTVTAVSPEGVRCTVEQDKQSRASRISATIPSGATATGSAIVPVKCAVAGENAPAIKIDIEGSAPAKGLHVRIDSQDERLEPGTVALLLDDDGTEKVIKKSALSKGGISFPLANDAVVRIVDRAKPFDDVAATDWFAREVVGYASARGIVNGVPGPQGATRFQGNTTTSRAMFVGMLANLEEADFTEGECRFDDVAKGDWFAGAAAWGSENGIVEGYGDGTRFGGNDPVTREQVAVFLMRYADMLGLDTSARTQPAHPDAASTSKFAENAIQWAVAEGLIAGDAAGRLNPTSTATRAEVATILMRFINTQLA